MSLSKIFHMDDYHLGIMFFDENRSIGSIVNEKKQWLRYEYNDRFFADPFLLEETPEKILILAEEYFFDERKGRIVILTVDRLTLKILSIEELIDDNTHLSFPYYDGKAIYPENCRSGAYYSYTLENKTLVKRKIIDIPCIDPIIYEKDGVEYLFTTLPDKPFENEMLYYKDGDKWILHRDSPIQKDDRYSRMAGHVFSIDGKVYRPVQDCRSFYGNKVHIMEIEKLSTSDYREKLVATVEPDKNYKYNEGIHTFNVENGFVLIDGYRFNNQIMKRIITTFKRKVLRRINHGVLSRYKIIAGE